jgi:uracil-DNA glycosylase
VLQTPLGVDGVATVHPSSILRSPDGESRDQAMADFVKDLTVASRYLD